MTGLLCLICVVIIILGFQIQSGFLKGPYLVCLTVVDEPSANLSTITLSLSVPP